MEFTKNTFLAASPKEVFTAWLNSEMHSAMTGGEANISDQVGESFDAWDGYINGQNLILEPHKRIVQSWRTAQFSTNEPDSQIEIVLEEKDGGTELTLIHTNVPESGAHYIGGWDDSYFTPMKAYFKER